MKVDLEVIQIASARTNHKCAYCGENITKSRSYTKILSRLDTERFPIAIKICSSHQVGLVPLSLLLRR